VQSSGTKCRQRRTKKQRAADHSWSIRHLAYGTHSANSPVAAQDRHSSDQTNT
jgi:hypothetical protein